MNKEDTEAVNNDSTQVGDFRKVVEVPEGTSWDEGLATSIFYQFIIPTSKPMAFQKNVQEGLTSWLASTDEWETDPDFTFRKNIFDEINKTVLDKLLDSTLKQLQDNASEYTYTTYKSFDNDGNEVEKKISFGFNLSNPKGFSIAENPEEDNEESKTYKEWLKVISEAKVEISALRESLRETKDDVKDTIKAKIKDKEDAITKAQSIIEGMKNFTFNDEVTLREVIQNTNNAQRFYLRMAFDPEDEGAAVALGNLIDEEYVTWEENPQAFENTYNVKWEDYSKEWKSKQDEYYKKLGLTASLRNAIENNEEIELDTDEFLQTYPVEYPIAVNDGSDDGLELNSDDDMKNWLEESTFQDILETLQPLADKYLRDINKFSKGAGGFIKLTEARRPKEDDKGKRVEFENRPIKMSKSDISDFLIKDVFNADSIKVPKKLSSKVQSNIKIKIDLPETELNTKELFAKEVGAESESVVGIEKMPRKKTARAKGSIVIDSVQTTDNAVEYLPYFSALEQYKGIRSALTSFLRRTKSTTEEAIESKKEWISKGNYKYLATYLNHLYEIQKIQEETSNFDIMLDPINLNYWLDSSGSMKKSYNKFVNDIRDYASGNAGETRFLQELKTLVKTFNRLDIIKEDFLDDIEEVEEVIDDLMETDESSFKTLNQAEFNRLNESQKEEYRVALTNYKESLRNVDAEDASSNRQQAQDERDELDATEAIEQVLQGTIDMDIDDNASIEDLDNDLDEIEDSDLYKYLVQMDGDDLQDIAQWLSGLEDEFKSFVRYKSMNINGSSFKKMLNEFANTVPGLKEDVKGYIDKIETEAFTDEGEQKGADIKTLIESIRNDLEAAWDSSKGSFTEPKKEDYIRLVNSIDLKGIIAEALEKDEGFNNARNAIVSINTRKLEVIIDLNGKEIKLKGSLGWKSMGIHTLGYKSRGQSPPKYWAQGTEVPATQQGKKVGYTGTEELVAPKPYDTNRYEYYKQIRTRASLLVGALR